MNNLSIFRKEVHAFLQRGEIIDAEHWAQLTQHLCDLKLFNPKQIKLLNANKSSRNYPISIPEFEQIIMRQFTNQSSKGLIKDIEQIKKQIRETKGVLSIWKEKGLTNTEIKALQVIFAKGNNRIKEICDELEKKKELIESINEQQIQMIKAMDQWVIMQKLEKEYSNFIQYQKINEKIIDQLFNQTKVREVHFRSKKPIKQIGDIQKLIGYNSKNDEQLEVWKIPKKSFDFDLINKQLVTFNALKNLSLSPYFLNFFGYNINSDPSNFLYFREYLESKNLAILLENSSIKLQEIMPIFRYWATQIFKGLKDIYTMSAYVPEFITTKEIQIAQSGLRLIFKNVQFYRKRNEEENIEPQLLKNLGTLILELLSTNWLSLNDKIHNIQNKCLLSALLKAPQDFQRYKDKIIPCYLNFHNIQTHPLFESNQELDGLEIISNYQTIFS